MAQIILKIAAAVLAAASFQAQALRITSMAPQGEVAQVRQVVAKFDEPAIIFGDARSPSPLSLSCSDAQAGKGTGRWTSDREWVFDFDADLPPGLRCSVQVLAGFQSPKGQPITLTGKGSYSFNTGGPFIQTLLPGTYQRIDEDQYFVLQLNGPATLKSILDHVWCEVDSLGERVPVRLIDGPQRDALLKSQHLTKLAAREPLSFVTLTCNRRLTPATKVQLVYGKGVSTPALGGGGTGIPNTVEKRFSFQVREPFAASFSCERENAQSACLPIRPMTLSFNAPVARKLAEAIRLTSAKGTQQPVFDSESGEDGNLVNSLRFKPLFAEQTPFTLTLPKDFKDASDRPLRNADSFPMAVATGAMPPLAKFAAAPFGIVERFAEPGAKPGDAALLPVTLRNVEADLQVSARASVAAPEPAGEVRSLQPKGDADIIAWYRKVQVYDNFQVERKTAADVKTPLPKSLDARDKDEIQSRMVSLLQGQPGVKTLALPRPANTDLRPFEVVGIPLSPGFHVVEIASQKLGSNLLEPRHGASRTMFVRSSALVTNLGVHFKLGRENALAWVTSLDKGAPVAGATVRVSDCQGKELAKATTNTQGIAQLSGLSSDPPRCSGQDGGQAYFVSARHTLGGIEDLAFTWSDWHKGIEPWRFNVPTSQSPQPDERIHTIFDRTLLRAGETVSMKHLSRSETRQRFELSALPPTKLLITHIGSGQQFTLPLAWRKTATGGQSAENSFAIPLAAKLGMYEVQLKGERPTSDGNQESIVTSGQFRVEEFRLPVLQGNIGPADKKPLVNVKTVPTDVQISYVAGGGAANLPVRVSALVRSKALNFSDYDDFSFFPPRAQRSGASQDEEESTAAQDQRVIANKVALTLDRNGIGKLNIGEVPASKQAQELLLEATFADPNGEVQTLRSVATVWPAGVVAGIKTEGWVSSNQKIRFQVLALNLGGQPAPGVSLEVKAVARIVTTSRKRMVGGFYAFDNQTSTKDLGSVCSGQSDARGLLPCEAKLGEPGEVELIVTARDAAGNSVQAASSVFVTRQGELWFGGGNHDRMDLLPEKKSYQPGETAKFQVRMPFRFATALVAVEREGILETQVVQLNGQDPTVSLTIKDSWGPNVYVSVLALRGRLREVPWYSFSPGATRPRASGGPRSGLRGASMSPPPRWWI